MRKINLILLFIACWVSVFSEIKPKRVESIPFELVGSYVVITLKINDSSPLNLILDSGVRNTIITEMQEGDHVSINYSDVKDLMGLGGGSHLEAFVSNYNTIKAGRIKMKNKTVYVLQNDIFNLSKHTGTKINGLIGADFFQDYSIEIDYVAKRLRFYEPVPFDNPKGYEVLPITIEQQKLFLELSVLNFDSTRQKVKMLIDTGALLNAWFQSQTKASVPVPPLSVSGSIGEGLNGLITGKYARIPEICVGSFKLKQPIVSFPDSASIAGILANSNRDGTIGSQLLSRFHLIVDYNNRKIYFKPNNRFDLKYSYNVAGIEIIQMSTLFAIPEVVSVWENSPASKAGVKAGDQILEVNGIKSYQLTINEIRKIFETTSKTPLNLVLKHENEEYSVHIEMKDKF